MTGLYGSSVISFWSLKTIFQKAPNQIAIQSAESSFITIAPPSPIVSGLLKDAVLAS